MDIHSVPEVRRALDNAGVHPAKGLGQNFLVDGRAAEVMVDALSKFGPERVLEIGPGLGALTTHLLDRGYKVVCIEMDRRLARFVRERYDVDVLTDDAVRAEWPPCDAVISNLPYSASSPITMKALENGRPAVFTYQRELADRILARPGTPDYSRLTVSVRTRCAVEKVMDLGPSQFHPRPAVSSTCLRLTPQSMFSSEIYPVLDRTLRLFFNQRRKTIRAVLKQEIRGRRLPPEAAGAPFSSRRPEELSLKEHGELAAWLAPFFS